MPTLTQLKRYELHSVLEETAPRKASQLLQLSEPVRTGGPRPSQEGLAPSPRHTAPYQDKSPRQAAPVCAGYCRGSPRVAQCLSFAGWENASISAAKFLSSSFLRHWSLSGGCHWTLVVNPHGWQRTWKIQAISNLKALISIISLTAKFSPWRNEKITKNRDRLGEKGQKRTF